MHFNSDFFIRRAFYSRLAHLFATTLGREMPEVKRSPPALCVRQETQCRADKKCSYIVNLWGGPLPGLMGPKTGHGSPRSEILATPLLKVLWIAKHGIISASYLNALELQNIILIFKWRHKTESIWTLSADFLQATQYFVEKSEQHDQFNVLNLLTCHSGIQKTTLNKVGQSL